MEIKMKLMGSLGEESVVFSAEEYGHAHAINEAIAYLTDLQVRAINADHDVRDTKEPGPLKGWQLTTKRKPTIERTAERKPTIERRVYASVR